MKVLHIEDNDSVLSLIRSICNSQIEIDSVSSLSEAKQKIEKGGIDLLLVNTNLVDSTGIETVIELKVYNLPIVILTKVLNAKLIDQALELGVDECIQKSNIKKINLNKRLYQAVEKHNRLLKMNGQKFSFGDISSLKPYISCRA